MRKIIKDFGLAVSTVSGVIGISEWVKRRDEIKEIVSKASQDANNHLNIIEKLRAEKKLNNAIADKNIMNLKDQVDGVTKNGKSLIEEIDKNNGSCITESCKKFLENYKASIKEAEELSTKVDKENVDIDISKSNIIPDDLISNYKEFLETLSDEQLLSIIHISFLVGILIIIYNFVLTYYSDYIIKYLSLESKYPKLARIFELRRKFQFYYMTINIIIMFLIVIILLILNLLVFTGGY